MQGNLLAVAVIAIGALLIWLGWSGNFHAVAAALSGKGGAAPNGGAAPKGGPEPSGLGATTTPPTHTVAL